MESKHGCVVIMPPSDAVRIYEPEDYACGHPGRWHVWSWVPGTKPRWSWQCDEYCAPRIDAIRRVESRA